METKQTIAKEKRKYIRLNSIFPVQFRLVGLNTKPNSAEWLQGFTSNVAKGGICLNVNNLKGAILDGMSTPQARIELRIEMPFSRKAIVSLGHVAWTHQLDSETGKYLIGLAYDKIDPSDNSRIIIYAYVKKLIIPALFVFIVALGFFLQSSQTTNRKLSYDNNLLVKQLIKVNEDYRETQTGAREISEEKEKLEDRIQALRSRFLALEEEKAKSGKKNKKIAELNIYIDQLIKDKDSLQEELSGLREKQNAVDKELSRLDKAKDVLKKASLDQMYNWLIVHQNPRTGLVMSFEGDKDLEDWAFIYDQSLVGQAYIIHSDFDRARKILEFFKNKAKRQDGLFFNAYYCNDGSPAEFIIHTGPNIWLGILAVQYTYQTKDNSYLDLAKSIFRAVFSPPIQDSDGGLRGGLQYSWYSTEHNLDAYAFASMLYELTREQEYKAAADRILAWIIKHTYDRSDIPIKRGKGDSTIATDTYAWSIAAIGPEKLEKIKMDPDHIMGFAEDNTAVEAEYTRDDGSIVKIKGFDFAAGRNLARKGIVSSEWTAQMVMAYKIMGRFYAQKGDSFKADIYNDKADEYLESLTKMIISSPSASGQGASCLAYATQDFADTGHGWFTPHGKSTGSLAGTSYALFAYYGFNPLELNK